MTEAKMFRASLGAPDRSGGVDVQEVGCGGVRGYIAFNRSKAKRYRASLDVPGTFFYGKQHKLELQAT